ncbi:S-adenosyl-L-methionine-dependent methyltransferase [Podospora fimiseda]|uniref:tRNA (guanine(26)-N(2))-dimethyltransferase n=1 Tax=Podospora fimiseda TaxID=252190 RepID=A0AAN7BNY1_9PEZI|nr:S-adenosyl-L-methionine-dependent methyltransferase [Podospora fimiseda]
MRLSLRTTCIRRIPGQSLNIARLSTSPTFIPSMSTEAELPGLDAIPAEGQRIKHNNVIYTTVKEGLAHILVPEQKDAKEGQPVQQVFYNPIQQFNRDLTIIAMKAYGKERMKQKQVASQAKIGKYAEKKRKRKEQANNDRPAKAAKLDNGVADNETKEPANATEETEPTETTETKTTEKKELPFTILDALSASGLRALRYAHEIPFLTKVTANDLLKVATESIQRNAIHNKLVDKIDVSHDDALAHMYQRIVDELRRPKPSPNLKYDIIDLDPYGSAAPFLDAAVQAIRDDGGLLCVTCTDSGVWASNGYPEKCFSLYGGVPLKGWYSHEVGLRIVLHSIETAAAKYGLAIEPLLSLSIDFYCRVFVRITKSPAMVKFQAGKNMLVYNCGQGCGSWTTQLLMKNKPTPNKKGDGIFYRHGFARAPTAPESCEHCGSSMHMAGPMYAGRIHDPEFVKQVIAEAEEASPEIYGTLPRVRGMLQTALEEYIPTPEELEAEAQAKKEESDETKKPKKKKKTEAEMAAIDPYPFYFFPAHVAGLLSCRSPAEAPLKGALRGMGYQVTRSHCKPGSIKTNAPWSVIWHVFKEWIRQKAPITEANIKPGTVAYRLLKLGGETKAVEGDEAADGTKTEENGTEPTKFPEVIFDEKLGKDPEQKKYVRYQMNPRENWGPLARATGK